MRKMTALLTVTLFLLAACAKGGDGGLSAADQEYVDAAMATFDPAEAGQMTEDDARCIVESMVGVMGADGLTEVGIEPVDFGSDDNPFPDGLTEETANDIVDGLDECIDLSGIFLDSMAQDDSISADARECLADAFDADLIRSIMVTMLTEGEAALGEDQELTGQLLQVFSECPGALPTG